MLILTVILLAFGSDSSAGTSLLPYIRATDITANFLLDFQAPSARSVARSLNRPIHFFGETFSSIKIFESGVVVLRSNVPLSTCPSPLDSYNEYSDKYIAVYWRRGIVNFLGTGRIFVQEKTYSPRTDYRILADIRLTFESDTINETNFVPTHLVIVTWVKIGAYNEELRTRRNTFQLVIASNHEKSFGLFLFGDIQYCTEHDQVNYPCPQPAKVGIRSDALEYWISNEPRILERVVGIHAYSNIKPDDIQYTGRYCLRFFGGKTIADPGLPLLFPRNVPPPEMQVSVAYCSGYYDEMVRHPYSCTMFVRCYLGKVNEIGACPGPGKLNRCPEGMSWSPGLQTCNCENYRNCQCA